MAALLQSVVTEVDSARALSLEGMTALQPLLQAYVTLPAAQDEDVSRCVSRPCCCKWQDPLQVQAWRAALALHQLVSSTCCQAALLS